MIKASFKNFMTGLIDYAGLFPPANLDIKTVVGNYAGYLKNKEGWMLGRCIIPAAQLHRVELHPGFRCSVIISPDLPEDELEQLREFKGRVEMVETRFPDSVNSPDRCSELLLYFKSRLLQAGMQDVLLFVETGNLAPFASSIATFNRCHMGGEIIKNVGYKLRCGGLTKQAFPAAEQVARVIDNCHEYDIPIKFTAGMHHPLRNHSPEIDAMQHGFLNIFAAALFCWSHNLSMDETAACISDGTADHFHFTEQNFSWQGITISAGEINRLRRSKVISFGSCSFGEPVEGLNSLGFLDNTGA